MNKAVESPAELIHLRFSLHEAIADETIDLTANGPHTIDALDIYVDALDVLHVVIEGQ